VGDTNAAPGRRASLQEILSDEVADAGLPYTGTSTRTRSSALTAGVSLSDLKDLALFWRRHVSAPAPLLLGLEPLTDLAKRLRAAHLALTLEPAESAELPRMCT
jgi:hypothetical protein